MTICETIMLQIHPTSYWDVSERFVSSIFTPKMSMCNISLWRCKLDLWCFMSHTWIVEHTAWYHIVHIKGWAKRFGYWVCVKIGITANVTHTTTDQCKNYSKVWTDSIDFYCSAQMFQRLTQGLENKHSHECRMRVKGSQDITFKMTWEV